MNRRKHRKLLVSDACHCKFFLSKFLTSRKHARCDIFNPEQNTWKFDRAVRNHPSLIEGKSFAGKCRRWKESFRRGIQTRLTLQRHGGNLCRNCLNPNGFRIFGFSWPLLIIPDLSENPALIFKVRAPGLFPTRSQPVTCWFV